MKTGLRSFLALAALLAGSVPLRIAAQAPAITAQPQSVTDLVGSTVAFSVAASGTPTPTYQWQFPSGVNIPGAIGSPYELINIQPNNIGSYVAVASNSNGSAASAAASLAIGPGYSITTLAGYNNQGSADGTGAAAQFRASTGLVTDSVGNIYVADTFNNELRKITPQGKVTTLAGLAGNPGSANGMGSAAQFNIPYGPALDASGNLYLADSGNNTIRKVTSGGIVTTIAGVVGTIGSANGSGTLATFNSPEGVAVDGSGNVYVADTGNNLIRMITFSGSAWTVSTVAGSGATGSANGTGTGASFNGPRGMAFDSSGNLYVADWGNNMIRMITISGGIGTVSTLAGTITAGHADGTNAQATFNGPRTVAVDGSGNVYVADWGNDTIREIASGGGVTTLAGQVGVAGFADGAGAAAIFNGNYGVAVDASGNIYVADTANNLIRKMTVSSGVGTVSTFAGTPAPAGSADGSGSVARFNQPRGVAMDSSGNIYVADTNNDTIREVTPAGAVTTIAGTAGVQGSTDATGAAASFNHPGAIAVDSSGNLYVADTNNDTIRMLTLSGSVWTVSTIGGSAGSAGSTDGAATTAAKFNAPSGIAVDSSGNVYVADSGNQKIREISSGTVTTIAGTGVYGNADGAGTTAAQFRKPTGIAVGGAGILYVGDYNNGTVRKLTLSGSVWTVSTLAGIAPTFGHVDGAGSAAQFQAPGGVAVDGNGNVYVADVLDYDIREISPSGVVTTLLGVNNRQFGYFDGLGAYARLGNNPSGVAATASGNIVIADTGNNLIRAGTAAFGPAITTQPTAQTAGEGGSATFSVVAAGSPAPTYQWDLNGAPISGATNSTLNLTNLTIANAGTYTVVVMNGAGSVTSTPVLLTGSDPLPAITTQPVAVAGTVGGSATFSVVASGSSVITYQWQRNGVSIAGATNASYTISNLSRTNADYYDVVVANGLTTKTLSAVPLTVAPPSYPGYVALDPAWNVRAENNGAQIYAIWPVSDGSFYAAGQISSANGTVQSGLFHVLSSGSLDTATFLPQGIDNIVYSLAVQSDGKIVIGGSFQRVGGAVHPYIARLNADGSLDATYTAVANGTVNAVALQSNGQAIIGGTFGTIDGTNQADIARLNTNGSIDSTFVAGSGFSGGQVEALAIQSNGQIVAGGYFTAYNGTSSGVNRLARINTNGSLDTTFAGNFGSGANNDILAVILDASGNILIGGDFTSISGTTENRIARITSTGALDTTFVTGTGANNTVRTILLQGTNLLVGGSFGQFSGTSVPDFCRLGSTGTLDGTFTPSAPAGNVYALAQQGVTNDILIGGSFNQVGGTTRQGFARLTAAGALDTTMSFTLHSAFYNISAAVPLANGQVLVAGAFSFVRGSQVPSNIARFNSDGSLDATYNSGGSGANNSILAAAQLPDGRTVIAGSFGTYNGNSANANHVAILTAAGAVDTTFTAPAINNPVYAVAVLPGEQILIGGNFTTVGGSSYPGVAVLNTNGTVASSFNPGTGVTGSSSAVYAAALQANGSILLGGSFTTYNGSAAANLVRVTPTGGIDSTFTPGSGPNSTVYAVDVMANGQIVIGGFFGTYNGTSRSGVARLSSTGVLDTNYVPPSGIGSVDAVLVQENGCVIVRGGFLNASGASGTLGIFRTTNTGTLDTTFLEAGLSAVGSTDSALVMRDNGQLFTSNNGTGFAGTIASLAPTIATQPLSQTVSGGSTVTLSTAIAGTLPATYQWSFNGATIANSATYAGVATSTLVISNLQPAIAGYYSVTATTELGPVTSTFAAVNGTGFLPAILTQPIGQSASDGITNVSFTVSATGVPVPAYQWQLNGTPISGATASTYSLSPATMANAGTYTVVVSNSSGSTTSNPAVLTVNPTPPSGLQAASAYGHAVPAGSNLYLSANYSGTGPVNVQWYYNGSPIAGATNPYYFIRTVAAANSGSYSFTASSAYGSATSPSFVLYVTPGNTWQWRNPQPTDNQFSRVGFANGKFFSGGPRGTLLTSTDGAHWTAGSVPSENNLYGLAYGQGLYVLLGGIDSIYTSPDGVTWTPRNSGVSVDGVNFLSGLQALAFGANKFVAVGENGQVDTSPDGINWTPGAMGASDVVSGLHFLNGKFYALGGTSNLYTSSDGLSWTLTNLNNTAGLNDISYGAGRYVIVGGSGVILSSIDAATWTAGTSGTTDTLVGVAFANNLFVATGSAGTILTSPDGLAWTPQTSPSSGFTIGAEASYGNGTFVLPNGAGSTTNAGVYTSPNGVTWTNQVTGKIAGATLRSIATGNGLVVAVGLNGTIYESPDGSTWTQRTSPTLNNLLGVSYGAGRFTAVGVSGVILGSTDGLNWSSVTSPTTSNLRAVKFQNGLFMAVGDSGTVITSPDGLAWTSRTTNSTQSFYGTTYGAGFYVVVGTNGTMLYSVDGINWASHGTGYSSGTLQDVTYANGLFVAVGTPSLLTTATQPSLSWTTHPIWADGLNFNAITYANGAFLVATTNSTATYFASADGVNWAGQYHGSADALYAMTPFNGQVIAVGADTAILATSSPAAEAPVNAPVPSSVTVTAGQNAVLSASIQGAPPATYQWQILAPGSSQWTNLSDGTGFSGSATGVLTVNSAPASLNGAQFRAVATNSQGTVTTNSSTLSVEATSAWTFTTLAGLTAHGSTDGASSVAQFNDPYAAAVDSSGNVYIADAHNNTIRKITPSGTVSTLAGTAGQSGSADGTGTAARFNNPTGIAVDGSGNVYVVDALNNTIRMITPGGAVSTLAGTAGQTGTSDGTGSAARFNFGNFSGLAIGGPSNSLYVADEYNNTIRVVTLPGGVVTTIAGTAGVPGYLNGTGTAALFDHPEGIAVDPAGNVYVCDTSNIVVRQITLAGVVSTLAGGPGLGGTSDGTTGSAARFSLPGGVAFDGSENLYVTDLASQTIRKVVISSGAVTTVAGKASISGSANGVGTAALFYQPALLAIDNSGNAYVPEQLNNDVRKIVLASMTVTTLAGTGGSSDGTGSSARFDGPRTVVTDGQGNLYVADEFNNTIRKVVISTGAVTTIAGQAGVAGSANGTGTAAQFNNPSGVAVDGSGNEYVADTLNDTIRVINSSGVVSTLAGTAGSAGSLDGVGAAARFRSPRGVLLDGLGNLYVTDGGNGTLRSIVISTGAVTTVAGVALQYGNVDGTGTAARLNFPEQMAMDTKGNIYITDSTTETLRKFNPATGSLTTAAGQNGVAGYLDGPASSALFAGPEGIAIDSAGNAYIADDGNEVIRMVSPAGVVTTIGGLVGVTGASDGAGTAARFNGPYGVATDNAGHIFIADINNSEIRMGTLANAVPVINEVPTTQLAPLGTQLGLTVSAEGATSYQWQFNGATISGATGSTYVIPSLQAGNVGVYSVVVANAAGSVTTRPIVVDIAGDPNSYTIDPGFTRPQFRRGGVMPWQAANDGSGNLLVTSYTNDGFEVNGGNHLRMDGILRLNGSNGTLDTTFSANPVVSQSLGVVAQADGRILVAAQTAGDQSGANGNQYFRVVRYNANGTVDSSYQSPVLQGLGRWMTVQPDGKLLVSAGSAGTGSNGGVNATSVVRLNINGSLDSLNFTPPTLAGGGLGGTDFAPLVVDANGKILIGGSFSSVNSVARPNIARLNSDGSLDKSFNPSGFTVAGGTRVRGIGIQSIGLNAGQIVIAGGPFTVGSGTYSVLRLNSIDGSLDTTFTLTANSTLGFTVAGSGQRAGMLGLLSDDRIAIVDTSVVQLGANGGLDPTFTPAVISGEALWLTVMPNNQIVVAEVLAPGQTLAAPGQTVAVNGTPVSGIFRLNTGGTLDTSFTPPAFDEEIFPNLGLVQTDNRVVVFGAFTEVNGVPRKGTVRFNLDGSIDGTFADPAPSGDLIFQPTSAGLSSDGRIYAVVSAGTSNSSVALAFDRINTNGTLDTGFMPASSLNIASRVDLRVTIQGAQPILYGNDPQDVINGAPLFKRLNLDGSVDTSFSGPAGPLGVVNRVGGVIDNVVAGSLHILGSVPGGGFLASVTTGSYPTVSPSTGTASGTYTFTLVKLNPNGSLAGGFAAPTTGGIGVNPPAGNSVTDPVNGNAVVYPNDGTFSPLSDPFTTAVVLSDGSVVAAGSFTQIGTQKVSGIVKLTPGGGIDSTFNTGSGPQITKVSGDQPRIDRIRVDSSGRLLITGDFDTFNGQPAAGFVRLTSTGAVDSTMLTDVSYYDYDGSTTNLLPRSDGSAYLLGLYRGASDSWPFGLTHLSGGAAPSSAPAISVQPVSTINSPGDNVSFTVTATGSPQPAYQWNYNGVPISGATSATLSISNILSSYAGVFTVTATNSQGSVTSSPAILAIRTSQIDYEDPGMNQPFQLAGDGTNLFVSGVNLNPSDPNRNATSHESIFKLPATGTGTATSIYPAFNPIQVATIGSSVFWIDPNSGPIGDTQILSAPKAGGGSVSAIYTGSSVGQPIVDGSGLTTDGTLLYAADEVNGSVWSLHTDGTALAQIGPNRYSGGFSTERLNTIAYSQGTLYVADSGGNGGTPAILSIPANGTGSSSFTTVYSGAPLVSPSGIAVGDGMIFVNDPGANNTIWAIPVGGGTPVAFIANGPGTNVGRLAGLFYSSGSLYIVDSGADAIYQLTIAASGLPAFTTQPQSRSATVGGSTTFTAAATGTPAPAYQWYLNGASISGATNSTYTLTNLQVGNTGAYSVQATNTVGTAGSAQAYLVVDQAITSSLTVSGTVQSGFSYQIQATGGVSPITYGVAGLPQGLSVNPSTGLIGGIPTQSGVFPVALTVTDANGDPGQATLQLTISAAPSAVPAITTQPASVTINTGQGASFTVIASGNPAFTYQWKKNGTAISGATSAIYSVAGLPADAGSYTVVLTNNAGSTTSAAAVLTVDFAPSITVQPVNVTASQGQIAGLSVGVTGVPAPTYQWRFNGNPITGATGAALTLPNVQPSSAGAYTVVVTNGLGSVTSNAGALTVNTAPVITTQPSGATVNQGGAAAFSVAATGNPAPTYQWRKNGTAIAGATLTSYSIPSTQLTDAAVYTVVVTNSVASVTSSGATLTVNAPPTILTQPAGLTVNQGQTATFTVGASGVPAPTYQWKLNTSPISGATGSSLSIPNAQSANAGTYTVVVANVAGNTTSNGATLAVNTPPVITGQPSSQTLSVGQSVTFTVAAGGTPAPTYQWKKNGAAIAGATNASYTIASAQSTDAGTYTVVATNSVGSVTSAPALLGVNSAPAITAQPVSVTVNQGQTAIFSVTATGIPAVTYQWQKGLTPITGATAATLILANAQPVDAASYTVVVTNTVSSVTSGAATLTVNVPPTITTQPSSQTAAAGANVTFSVAIGAGASPAPTYQWTKNGLNITGATNASLALNAVTAANAASYAVIVANAGGTVTSNTATLTVNSPPVITSQPVSATINQGQTATFSVAATGVPGSFTYQWSKGSSAISAATNASLVISNAQPSDAASYTVVVTNTAGSATSNAATLTLNAAPLITTQPSSQTVAAGASVTFTAAASGTPAPTYQWTKNGASIVGATGTTLTLPGVTLASAASYAVIAANSVGSVVSNVASLTVNAAPVITTQPVSLIVGTGSTVSFTVAATGYPSPAYQWSQGASALSGATNATLILTGVTSANAGSYTVTVSNSVSSATSNAATLTVNAAATISTQPQSQTVTAGTSVTFTVAAGGTAPITYQWQKNGSAITGATSASYTIASAQASDSGAYTVVVTNPGGSLTSATATLTVNAPPARGLVVGSARAFLDSNVPILTGSFTVEGLASKQMLIRADGPSLASRGLSGALAAPQLEIDNSAGTVVATNTAWGTASNAAQISTVGTQVGAFAFASGSADSAVLATFAPGTYTVKVTGAGGATGVTMLEIYDADTNPRLVYLASEADVGQGNRVLVQGITINALPAGRSYLIRAIGPSLGTPGALSAPQVSVYNSSGTSIASGTSWGGSSAIANLANSVGAMPLSATSNDAAINFQPPGTGNYTVQMSGVGSATGLALLEIFEVDSQRATSAAPAIVAQPVSLSIPAGQAGGFGVVAVALPGATYQWSKGGTPVIGATNSQYVLSSIQSSDAGSYSVAVTNSGGSVQSASATLTVLPALALPTITAQPDSATVIQGQTATFTVAASGNPAPSYQWYFNGSALNGATSPTLTLGNAQSGVAGSYAVIVTNSVGSVTSASAVLTVNPAAPVIVSPLTAAAVSGAAFNYLIATNPAATSFTAIGLPTGLTFSATGGNISGVPTQTGAFTVTIGAANVTGAVTASLVLTVQSPPPVITSGAAASGQVGSGFTYTTQASNNPTSYSITSGALPAGLTLNAQTGVINGTPTQSGLFFATLTATNATGSVSLPLNLTINPAPLAPVFSGNSNPGGTQGTVFSYTPSFTNNVTGYALVSLANGSPSTLPTGLNFSTTTGAVNGTPSQVGVFNLALQATGSGGSATAQITLTINPAPTAPTVTSASTATATVGSTFTYATTVSTTATAFAVTGLPTGLSIDPAGGSITGTPSVPGTYNVGITATNAVGTGPTALLVLTVNPSALAPVITSSPALTGTVGTAFSSTVAASNSPTSFTITSGTLPAGLSLDAPSGNITGNPTQVTTTTVWIAGSNGNGLGPSLGILVTIQPAPTVPTITSNGTAAGQVGQPFSYQITATNSPTSYAATGLPTGLSLDPVAGVINGIPGAATTQAISVTLSASNGSGTGNPQTLLLTINPAPATPVINSASTASGQVGVAFSYQIGASNTPTSFAAANLPNGLSADPNGGLVNGTPTQAGTFTASLQAGNAGGLGAASNLTITIAAAALAPSISSAAATTGQVGVAFSYQTVAAPGTITGYGVSGTLPPGLTFNTSSGLLSGNPADPGLYSVSVTATNSVGTSLPQTLVIYVSPAANVPVITSAQSVTGAVGVAFSYTVTATNMPSSTPFPPSVALDAVFLPTGLAINPATGAITGTPTQSGTFAATVQGVNANGSGPQSTLTITIQPAPSAPVINSQTSAQAQAGQPFAYQVTATNSPSSFQVLGLPAWMSVNSQTGAVTGSPTAPGPVSVQLVASNSGGASSPVTLAISVAPAANTPVVTSSQTASGQVSSSFSYQILATGSPTSYFASGVPQGLLFNSSTGSISGTPTASGAFAVAVAAVNANGQGASATVTVTIQPSAQLGF